MISRSSKTERVRSRRATGRKTVSLDEARSWSVGAGAYDQWGEGQDFLVEAPRVHERSVETRATFTQGGAHSPLGGQNRQRSRKVDFRRSCHQNLCSRKLEGVECVLAHAMRKADEAELVTDGL